MTISTIKVKVLFAVNTLQRYLTVCVSSVVVSQWTSMLNIVQVHLEKAGIRCDTIKGSMRPIERQRVVDSFNSDSRATEACL
jgi:SNF2 family DNA or RNA helicase